MGKTEFALETFKNLQELVKFIDQKTGATLVISGLILTIYLNLSKNLVFVDINSMNIIKLIIFVSSLTTLISIFIVIHKAIKILKPRLATNYNDGEKSIFYFEHISTLGKDEILDSYKEIDENTMLKYIIEQQYEVSLILEKKTKDLKVTFNYLFVSIVSLVIFAISISLS